MMQELLCLGFLSLFPTCLEAGTACDLLLIVDLHRSGTRPCRLRPLHGIDIKVGHMFRYRYRDDAPNLYVIYITDSLDEFFVSKKSLLGNVEKQTCFTELGAPNQCRLPCYTHACLGFFPSPWASCYERYNALNFWNDPVPPYGG
jgi:hypothetical protein